MLVLDGVDPSALVLKLSVVVLIEDASIVELVALFSVEVEVSSLVVKLVLRLVTVSVVLVLRRFVLLEQTQT